MINNNWAANLYIIILSEGSRDTEVITAENSALTSQE